MKTRTYIIFTLIILSFAVLMASHFSINIKESAASASVWPDQKCPEGGWVDLNPAANGRTYECAGDEYKSANTYCPGNLQNDSDGICRGEVGPNPYCDDEGWDNIFKKCVSDIKKQLQDSSDNSAASNSDNGNETITPESRSTKGNSYVHFSHGFSFI